MRYVGVIYDTAQGMDTLVSELSMLSKLSLDKVPFYFEKTILPTPAANTARRTERLK